MNLVTGLIILGLVLLMLVARIPIAISLGLPALIVLMISGGTNTAYTLGLELTSAFNLYNTMGFILWAATAAVAIESGLAQTWLLALLRIARRDPPTSRIQKWDSAFLGLPLTMIALLLLAGAPVLPDGHFLLLQMLIVLVLLAILVGGWMLLSTPKITQVSLKRIQSTDGGDSWRVTGKTTAAVNEDGSTHRTNTTASAWLTLLLPGLLAIFCLLCTLFLPVSLSDLAGPVWIIVLLASLFRDKDNRAHWFSQAGIRAAYLVGVVAGDLLGAWLLGTALESQGLVMQLAPSGGTAALGLLILAVVSAAVAGKLFGPVAGALLTVTVLSPAVAPNYDYGSLAVAAASILGSLLVGAACIGGAVARLLPPRHQPWPLTPTPIF